MQQVFLLFSNYASFYTLPIIPKLCQDIVLRPNEKYLFCPALIRLEVPPRAFVYQEKCLYHFGWILSTSHTNRFLDARFLHVLLALSLGLAPQIDPDIPALQHQCSVWKTGVCWNTPHGAKVLVEVLNKKKVVVLIQSNMVSSELLELQSAVLCKVRECAIELCPSVATKEFLISPTDMTYPLNISPSTPLFSLKSVAQSLVQQHPFVVSVSGTEQLPVSSYEVCAHLGERILRTLFNSAEDEITSDQFLSALCSCWSKCQVVDIVYSTINKLTRSTAQITKENLYAALKSWRDGSGGTSDL